MLGAQHEPIIASTVIVGGRGRLMGINVDETAGAAAEFIIYDGIAATSRPLLYVRLAADENRTLWFSGGGVTFQSGLFVGAITGDIQGQLYVIPQTLEGSQFLVDESGSDRRMRIYVDQRDLDALFGG